MAWRKDATERRSIWPYRVFENHIKVEVTGVLLRKGSPVRDPFRGKNWMHEGRSLNSAFLNWQVYQETEQWDQMQLDFAILMHKPDAFVEYVFPSGRMPQCVFAIDGLCKSTRWRQASVAPYDSQGVTVRLDVDSRDVAGNILFSPSVLLWEERTGTSKGEAVKKGSRIATGFPFQIQVNQPMERPGKGIEILWSPFPDEVSDSMFELIIEPPKPILRINNRHPSLKAILEDLSKVGNRATIRNAMFTFIAADVWMQLAEFAAHTEKSGIDDEDDPAVILSSKILRTLTKMLKRPVAEILEDFDDSQSRKMLRLHLQHHLKTLSKQDALITGLVAEEEAQDFPS